MGIIKKLFGGKKKSDAKLHAEAIKKATDNWNANNTPKDVQDSASKNSNSIFDNIDPALKKNIRTVLIELAERGESGVLSTSISDKTDISMQNTSTALSFLTENNYVELVNSPIGAKYYITEVGKKLCISKKFNSGF